MSEEVEVEVVSSRTYRELDVVDHVAGREIVLVLTLSAPLEVRALRDAPLELDAIVDFEFRKLLEFVFKSVLAEEDVLSDLSDLLVARVGVLVGNRVVAVDLVVEGVGSSA